MKIKHHIGLLGGTFDPIHNGHLHIAHEVWQQLSLNHIELIPCHHPAHKPTPVASGDDRKKMIELAIQDHPQFKLNTHELGCERVSYTINTLKELTAPDTALYFIIGFDAFLQFHTWLHWQDILNYCHLVVVNRPEHDAPIPNALAAFYQKHKTDPAKLGKHNHHGCILMLNIKPNTTSATAIRARLAHDANSKLDLPEAVRDYIRRHHLY